eukprot:5052833-Pyramimonas_sp.AAC.1
MKRAASGRRPSILRGHDTFTSSSGSAAHGTGVWTPSSLENGWRGQARAAVAHACPDRPIAE